MKEHQKNFLLSTLILFTLSAGFSQSIIQWSDEYQLELSDFQSPETEVSAELATYSIQNGASFDFAFQMSSYEFMFTKNFNCKVEATFNRSAAVITAPDSSTALRMVTLGQYCFDLTELYARKFRQQIQQQKGMLSDAGLFTPIFQALQTEVNAEYARVMKATELGFEAELLAQEHAEVLRQLAELSDFCFSCKLPKKNNRKGP